MTNSTKSEQQIITQIGENTALAQVHCEDSSPKVSTFIKGNGFDINLVAKWIADCDVKSLTKRAYLNGLKNFWRWCKSQPDNLSFSPDTIHKYRGFLVTTYSASTSNLYLTSVKSLARYMFREGLIAKDVGHKVKGIRRQRRTHMREDLNINQVTAIKNLLAGGKSLIALRDAAMFAVMVNLGLRCCEVSRLNDNDITPIGNGEARVAVWGKAREQNDTEDLTIPAGVFALIKTYLDKRGNFPTKGMPLFQSRKATEVMDSDGHIDISRRLTPESISHTIKKAMRKVGIDSPKLTAHSLRHTFATAALDSGIDIRQLQKNLRHSSVRVTETYTHDLAKKKDATTATVASALGY